MGVANLEGPNADRSWMRLALRLARRAYGQTSPNPAVGAVLVKDGKLLGRGWHRQAGSPHAEIEALRDAQTRGQDVAGATLYVTLEPCSTTGRTPPCTEALIHSRVARVVAAATDPNPNHAGRGFDLLRQAGIEIAQGLLESEANELNEAFNHWIVSRTPFVTVKAAMSADGKIATHSGLSKWITGEKARAFGMKLRQGADAVLVGIQTVLADNPRLTFRPSGPAGGKGLRRIVLDTGARIPLDCDLLSDAHASSTTVVVAKDISAPRVRALSERVNVLMAPACAGKIDLSWLLAQLGREGVTHLLVEGGGEINASFLFGGFTQRVVFFYAPLIIGGRAAPGGVGGLGASSLADALRLRDVKRQQLGNDLILTARVDAPQAASLAP